MTETEKKLIRAARAAYAREYRKKHPEKAREAQERYWARKASQMAAQTEADTQDAADAREVGTDAGK